jgi:hypothetical protein
VPNGSDFVIKAVQLSIERFINHPQCSHKQPTHATIFFVFDLTALQLVAHMRQLINRAS